MTATLDRIIDLITPPRALVAAPYSAGQEVLLLHLLGHTRRAAGWVLPTVQDCERMKLKPIQQEGYLLVRVDDEIDADLPPKYDRVNWVCCDFLLELPLDPDTLAAISAFNRASRLDKFLAYADSLQPKRNTHV